MKSDPLNPKAMRAAVVVERQLWQQMAVVERLENVNEQMSKMLERPGAGSMTDKEIQELQKMWQEASGMMNEVQHRQNRVIDEIYDATGSKLSLGEFIRQVDELRRNTLESLRGKLVKRLQAAFGRLVGNQATLIYLFEFHRNFIGSLVHHDFSDNKYSEKGRSRLMSSGILLHRAV